MYAIEDYIEKVNMWSFASSSYENCGEICFMISQQKTLDSSTVAPRNTTRLLRPPLASERCARHDRQRTVPVRHVVRDVAHVIRAAHVRIRDQRRNLEVGAQLVQRAQAGLEGRGGQLGPVPTDESSFHD